MKKNTLSLCLIVKNEEKFIKACLDAVKDIVDEIIIVDTGSTDSTLEIIKSYKVKLFNYEWNNDFSSARNYSISKATSNWILCLDADEILDNNSKDNLLNFINTTNFDGCHFLVYNYISEHGNDYTLHYAFRLFRNNKGYYYTGKIHEQIANDNENNLISKFSSENIILHHYGYSFEVLKEKDKRSRNIPILLEILKENPNDGFSLFNLGNEYMAENDISKAIEYYELSYKNKDIKQHYSIHLLYRLSICYQSINNYNISLKYIDEALQYYSPNVDFEYLKGCIYLDSKKYTLAIDSLNKCLEIGDSVSSVKFINNCGTINPLLSLGDLYFNLSDYEKALFNYNKALSLDNNNLQILYKIGSAINKKHENKNKVTKELLSYFETKDFTPNIIFLIDILIREKLFNEAEELLENHNFFDDYIIDENYLRGVISFYKKDFTEAIFYFNNVFVEKESTDSPKLILSHAFSESSKFIFALSILINNNSLNKSLEYIRSYTDPIVHSTYLEIHNIFINNKANIIKDNTKLVLIVLEDFLSRFLILQEFDMFQSLIEIYNYIEDKSILISLAKVYSMTNFKDIAKKNVILSIKTFDYIDAIGLDILYS
jgi:glycosyltransferase involved in cell wall biosynthesis